MKKMYLLFFITLFLFLIFSCRKPDITPVYLILDDDFVDCIDVSDFNSVHETNYDDFELNIIKKHLFTAVSVSINGNNRAPILLPCTIPLIPDYSKENNIRIVPCVRLPNANFTVEDYHFLSPVEEFFTFEKEEEFRFPPFKLKYVPSVRFELLETFVNSTRFEAREPEKYPTTIELLYDEEKKKNLGTIMLKDSATYFDVVTDYILMNGKGERQYFEITYKSTGEMFMYLNYKDSPIGASGNAIIVFPSSKGEWKTLYADITEEIQRASYTAPQINVRLQLTGNTLPKEKDAYFYFDNIRIITMTSWY